MKNYFTFLVSILFILILLNHVQAAENVATFAGGCYWCMEDAMEHVEGVVSVTSGFASNVEAVQVVWDPSQTTYEKLLSAFWRNIDPTDAEGQFCDRGPRYESAIFYYDAQQKAAAEKSKDETEKILGKSIVTPIIGGADFRPVPESEQDYSKKKPFEYKQYKMRCGRERRLRSIWK
jgi:peptide-methionine (S)-S-oxide reductase